MARYQRRSGSRTRSSSRVGRRSRPAGRRSFSRRAGSVSRRPTTVRIEVVQSSTPMGPGALGVSKEGFVLPSTQQPKKARF